MTDIELLYVTVPDVETARRIEDTLLSEGLIACSNRWPGMESKYHWQGKIETAREEVLILKTTRERVERARARIETLHPYQVPCILSLPVSGGNGAYLDWLRGSLG